MPMPFQTLVVHAGVSSPAAMAVLQSAAQEGVAGLKIQNAAALGDIAESTVTSRRMASILIVLFAVLSISLAAVGIYGVVSYSVGRRIPEMGMRIALGATRGQIAGLVIQHGLRIALGGVMAGLVLSALSAPVARFLLYDVSPFDPIIYVFVPILAITVVMIACLIPAWRAANVDPITALREE
jgi:ABC-type antimicrobial peptide transport system permease subunit